MPVFESQRLGSITYDPESAIEFPRGLPGFDERRAFVAVHLPGADPLIFLQSLEDPGLCFITAPVGAVDPAYHLEVGGRIWRWWDCPFPAGPSSAGRRSAWWSSRRGKAAPPPIFWRPW